MRFIRIFTSREGTSIVRAYISIYRKVSTNTIISLGFSLVLPFTKVKRMPFDSVTDMFVDHSRVVSMSFRYRTSNLFPRFLLSYNTWLHAV